MAGAVDVCVVTLRGLVLDVRGRDGDATGAFFRCGVDHVVRLEFRTTGLRQRLGDSSGQRGLAVIDVTNRADVAVRLIPLKFSLCHRFLR